MDKQRTIEKEISLQGEGLHTGHKANIVFKPAEADTGVVFVRTDLPGKPAVRVSIDTLVASPTASRRTSIGIGGLEIQTVEHLMAVFSGMGIDNIRIEINGDELAGFDGSSLNYLDAISKAGIREQDSEREYFIVREPVFVEEEGVSLIAVPSKELKISYTLHFDHPYLKSQFKEIVITPETFAKEIAPARTFCLEEDIALRRQGFGHGATYDNTLVVGKNGVIKNTLRFPDEFVRHKILDLLGDMFLLGQPIKCHIIAVRSGHAMNLKLARKIALQRQRYALAGIGAKHSLTAVEASGELDSITVMKILPHREPFLFVDKITSLEKGKRATGIKNVTINDYFFRGHFPGKPVMPGVIIVEAMAQVGGVMMLASEENRGKLAYFMAADRVKFRKTVVPGDQLVLDVVAGKIKSRTGQVYAKAYVDGKVVAEAELMFALA